MGLQKFIADFADQFDYTDACEIMADTKFKELDEWCSFTMMILIAFIIVNYGKNITGTEIRDCGTVKELYDFILSK